MPGSLLYGKAEPAMISLLSTMFDQLNRMGSWFDHHFGWFFTNGMKQRQHERSFKA
jgi:hypothetical protein